MKKILTIFLLLASNSIFGMGEPIISTVDLIQDLETKACIIPEKEYQENLDAYRNLHSLDDSNPLYTSKIKFYTKKLEGTVAGYKLITKKDLSHLTVKKRSFKIEVDMPTDEEKLMYISKKIVNSIISTEKMNAILLFYYYPCTDYTRSYSAGKVVWAPYGNWDKAEAVTAGDYQLHKYSIDVKKIISKKYSMNMTESKKQQVFYDVIKLQENGYGGSLALELIAKNNGLAVDEVSEIVNEGDMCNWPRP
ncbi:MAG: hypothetical protein A2Y40_03140 [Candidatus Margulisbacteria bacterium GWF2_35_9]|nr:MAG: hypothetical protein A2Y40_03140 [Candidatus Margulisbacteria bacterium GWF2_35_9]